MALNKKLMQWLPLRLVDHTGNEFDYLLRRVHAAPAFAFTLFAWGPLESIGGALHLEDGKRYMTLPGDAPVRSFRPQR